MCREMEQIYSEGIESGELKKEKENSHRGVCAGKYRILWEIFWSSRV